MGWGDGPDCQRCWQPTEKCDVCKGDGHYSHAFTGGGRCTECDGTGYKCREHGRFWKR